MNIKTLLYNSRAVRMAVLNDGVWYLSQELRTGMTRFEILNASAAMWGAWEELKGAESLPAVPVIFATSGSELTNIQAVGFYFSALASEANGARLEMDNFKASALVTPHSN